jgi:hypothetical protein
VFAAAGGQEDSEIPDGGQPVLDRAVRAWAGPGPARAFPGLQARTGECCHCGAERSGNGVDPALPAAGREPPGLARWQGQAAGHEERFQGPGQGARRPAAAQQLRSFQQGLRVPGPAVGQQPPELADQARCPGGTESGSGAAGEITEPGRRVIEAGGQGGGGDEWALGVLLPAAVTQA